MKSKRMLVRVLPLFIFLSNSCSGPKAQFTNSKGVCNTPIFLSDYGRGVSALKTYPDTNRVKHTSDEYIILVVRDCGGDLSLTGYEGNKVSIAGSYVPGIDTLIITTLEDPETLERKEIRMKMTIPQKDSVWEYFDSSKLVRREIWENGTLVSTTNF